jgi:hypothetical protein
MTNNNPQLYRISTQQLKVLRTLAKMSIQIGDREGIAIIQAAETAIEHRIQITHMNLSALEYLEHLISQGHDYADAEWRTTQCYPKLARRLTTIDSEELRTAYDNRPQAIFLTPHDKTLLDDIIAIADGMDVLDRGSREFEYAQQNLDRAIDKLDLWNSTFSHTNPLSFDSSNHYSCRDLAAQLLGIASTTSSTSTSNTLLWSN